MKPGWLTVAYLAGSGLLIRAAVVLKESRPLWGQGVWAGAPGPEIIEERCEFTPMPDYDNGPLSP